MRRIFIGDIQGCLEHWARRGLVVAPRRRGLDTGCVYGGPLTAWVAEEDRIVQTPDRAGPIGVSFAPPTPRSQVKRSVHTTR